MKRIFALFVILIPFLHACQVDHDIPLQNVVVILADDHALNVTGTYGNELIRTPNIDRLAGEGITFDRAYCNAPICSASRQSLLTGKYPHATGVNLLFTPFPDYGNTTIAEHLRTSGYETAIIGKNHWNNWVWAPIYKDGMPDHGFNTIIENGEYKEFLKENPPALLPKDLNYYSRQGLDKFDDVAERMNCNTLPHQIDDAHSKGTFYANEAVKYMETNKNQPFFLWLAFNEPHQPFYFPVEFADRYNPEDMPLPEGSPEDDRWVPDIHKNFTKEEKQGIIASYYTSTEYMDKNIGIVLDAIERLELTENTLVIYISDNGYLLYEHKRFEKHTMWEESTHQPMIIRAGSNFRPGTREQALVEYIDIVPTILEMTGQMPLLEAQGESFYRVITNKAEDHKNYAFSEFLSDNLVMITDGKWKYVFTTGNRELGISYTTGHGPSGIVHRLYNLEKDPLEHHNVSGNPENSGKLVELQEAMLQIFMKTHPDADRCPETLTTEGKLVWFSEPRDVGEDQTLNEVPKRVFKNNQD